MEKYDSDLLRLLRLVGSIAWPIPPSRRGRPYVYAFPMILKGFIVRVWQRIDSTRGLHAFLTKEKPYNRTVCRACFDDGAPSRRTLDRRFKALPPMLKRSIKRMAEELCRRGLVDPLLTAVDSSLLAAKGSVWHTSSMARGEIPCPGIDTGARWGRSATRGWVFGYKLHLISSALPPAVPLSADVTPANVPDNQVYPRLTDGLPRGVGFTAGDEGYDDQDLYALSLARGRMLVAPVKRFQTTPPERLALADFYESSVGRAIYGLRSISVEPLTGQVKEVFRLDPLPLRGTRKVSALCLLCVLVYQLVVLLNHREGRPLRRIKHLLTT